VAFLKFNEVRLRRQSDRNFVLDRRQNMDPELFGDPRKGSYIISVSHAWLSPTHADRDGVHLDLLIERLGEKLPSAYARYDWCLARWWWKSYYLESEGDILIFFDMSSLYQAPRTPEEEKDFKQGLGLINFLYYSFDVLVIPEIPKRVEYHGVYLEYLDKGWCWAESSIAFIGGKLWPLSPDLMQKLAIEKQMREDHFMSLSDALLGQDKYPPELMQRGHERELMQFRKGQDIPGKIFTNGKFDSDRVASILVVMDLKRKLETRIKQGQVETVKCIFANDDNFAPKGGDLTRSGLANSSFDSTFTTPLHLAVKAGSVELVHFLVSHGATPRRNCDGLLPWERFIIGLRISEAAIAAREAFTVKLLPSSVVVEDGQGGRKAEIEGDDVEMVLVKSFVS